MKAGSAWRMRRDVVAGRLAVVDEERDVHRFFGRHDFQHFARHLVFAHDEVGRPEAEHRLVGLVQDADVEGPLDRLRRETSRPDDEHEGDQRSGEKNAPIGHPSSIGLAFEQRQGTPRRKQV